MANKTSPETVKILKWITNNPTATSKDFQKVFPNAPKWKYYDGRKSLLKEGAIKDGDKLSKGRPLAEPKPQKVKPDIGKVIPIRSQHSRTLQCLYRDLEVARDSHLEILYLLRRTKKKFWDTARSLFPDLKDYDIAIEKPFKEIQVLSKKNREIQTMEEIEVETTIGDDD